MRKKKKEQLTKTRVSGLLLNHLVPLRQELKCTINKDKPLNVTGGIHRTSDFMITCSMLGFSKGGLPRDPSTTGWLICRMHFLSSYGNEVDIRHCVHLQKHQICAYYTLYKQMWRAALTSSGMHCASAYLEQVEVHLFGVSVLLFVYGHKEVLHIHHHSQQPVYLILRHVLQVGHVISCERGIGMT